jgi:hypothetical protein
VQNQHAHLAGRQQLLQGLGKSGVTVSRIWHQDVVQVNFYIFCSTNPIPQNKTGCKYKKKRVISEYQIRKAAFALTGIQPFELLDVFWVSKPFSALTTFAAAKNTRQIFLGRANF